MSSDLKSHHEEGNDTSKGNGTNKLGSGVTGGLGAGTTASGGANWSNVTINNQVTASNTGTVVVNDDRASDHRAVGGGGERELGIQVPEGGDDTSLGSVEVTVLSGQITSLASGQVGRDAVVRSDGGGVEMCSGGLALKIRSDGRDVDVVFVTGGLVDLRSKGDTLDASNGDVHTALNLVEGEGGLDILGGGVDGGGTVLEFRGGTLGSNEAGKGEDSGSRLEKHDCVYVCDVVLKRGELACVSKETKSEGKYGRS